MMDKCIVRIQLNDGARLPVYSSGQAAGADLCACLGNGSSMTLEPHKWALVPTGLSISLPVGYEAQVRPRSGLAAKAGITVLNSPGTIDSDYRGEVKVILINHSDHDRTVSEPVWTLGMPDFGQARRILQTFDGSYNVGVLPVPIQDGLIPLRVPAWSATVLLWERRS